MCKMKTGKLWLNYLNNTLDYNFLLNVLDPHLTCCVDQSKIYFQFKGNKCFIC